MPIHEYEENDLEFVNCNLCEADNFQTLLTLRGLNIGRCKICGLVYVNPRLKISKLTEIYAQKDTYNGSKGHNYLDEDREAAKFRRHLDKIQDFKRGGKLLDVGCGTGIFLQEARKNGWECFGIEVSDFAANFARQKGIQVFHGPFQEAKYEQCTFDVITMWETLEHLENPKADVTYAYNLLKKGGLLFISVPNFKSLKAQIDTMIGRYTGTTRWHRPVVHLYVFSGKTLQRLFIDSGFTKVKRIYINPHVGVASVKGKLRDFIRRIFSFFNLNTMIYVVALKSRD